MNHWYRARSYRPEVGRFMQRDPLGYVESSNMFVYVANTPLSANDPTGTQSADRGSGAPVPGGLTASGYSWWCDLNSIANNTGGPISVIGANLWGFKSGGTLPAGQSSSGEWNCEVDAVAFSCCPGDPAQFFSVEGAYDCEASCSGCIPVVTCQKCPYKTIKKITIWLLGEPFTITVEVTEYHPCSLLGGAL
ncbi:MAG: RHS repeat domain-containing protein [Planctomycetota bacterium]